MVRCALTRGAGAPVSFLLTHVPMKNYENISMLARVDTYYELVLSSSSSTSSYMMSIVCMDTQTCSTFRVWLLKTLVVVCH